jgi:hypothetical protein
MNNDETCRGFAWEALFKTVQSTTKEQINQSQTQANEAHKALLQALEEAAEARLELERERRWGKNADEAAEARAQLELERQRVSEANDKITSLKESKKKWGRDSFRDGLIDGILFMFGLAGTLWGVYAVNDAYQERRLRQNGDRIVEEAQKESRKARDERQEAQQKLDKTKQDLQEAKERLEEFGL